MANFILCCIALTLLCGQALAQDFEPASTDVIEAETRYLGDLEGPQPGTQRAIAIWRPPSTPAGARLPTLYMADGPNGVYTAAARLRPAIEAGLIPAIQVIGLYPDQRRRQGEYIHVGRRRFNEHARWVLEIVIPWAERLARASPERRAIGGYSNGAAFALFMAAAHPDVFSAVLAHSPVESADTFHLDARARRVRWAITAGRLEYRGYPARAAAVVGAAAAQNGAAVRTCIGPWGHLPGPWMELTPGTVAWMFDLPGAEAAATELERSACQTTPGR